MGSSHVSNRVEGISFDSLLVPAMRNTDPLLISLHGAIHFVTRCRDLQPTVLSMRYIRGYIFWEAHKRVECARLGNASYSDICCGTSLTHPKDVVILWHTASVKASVSFLRRNCVTFSGVLAEPGTRERMNGASFPSKATSTPSLR